MESDQPFHRGEVFIQEMLREQAAARRNGEAIGNAIMPGAVKFLLQQPVAIVSSVDGNGRAWVSWLMGSPGFISTADLVSLRFDLGSLVHNPHDPLWTNLQQDPRIGILLIEPATRRRLRINGRLVTSEYGFLTIEIDEAYPNCPKYIQQRAVRVLDRPADAVPAQPVGGGSLTSNQRDWLRAADTFFVGSEHSERGLDASHRGGKPGFVEVVDDRTLRIPDYSGNSMYNTLGNLVLNPQAGLLFVDFEQDRTLQLTGQVSITWDADDSAHPTGGTRRFWEFQMDESLESKILHFLRWEFVGYSPLIPT